MITTCPHCGQKVRVGKPGKYRCPSCSKVFLGGFDPILTLPGDEPEDSISQAGHDHNHPRHERPDRSGSDENDLYIDSKEAASACETCNRPGATNVCKSCGAFVCNECAVKEEGSPLCPRCYVKQQKEQELGADAIEDINAPSFINSFVPRLKSVLFSPSNFFSRPIPNETPFQPFLFAIICHFIGGIFVIAYTLIWARTFLTTLESNLNVGIMSALNLEELLAKPGQAFVEQTLLLPFNAFLGIFIISSVVHLGLLMFGKPLMRFPGTIRVVAYSNATGLLQIVPFIGAPVAFIWQIAIVIIGTSRVHKISGNKTAVAVMLPFVILIFFGAILAFLMVPALLERFGLSS